MARKYSKKQAKKIRNLVAICSLCGIMLLVSTYAWFIGMKTVDVAKFEINIATTEGLFLSLDGETWTYNLDINDNVTNPQYAGNTNQGIKGDDDFGGLIPRSSVGEMDKATSRMKMFEKSSLTAITGGYRLLSDQLDNSGPNEAKGYVAFDLFIKNLSGEEYYVENNPDNEEAIYLTTNSEVKVDLTGGGVENTGIENSVRVGFAQIGRVSAEYDTAGDKDMNVITSMNCNGAAAQPTQPLSQVTGICRTATIWEPNEKAHTQNAINWYNESCLPRTQGTPGTDVLDPGEYDNMSACKEITTSKFVPTYAISDVITVDNAVNIYDGTELNSYAGNEGLLQPVDTFTDEEKGKEGNERPEFMTLAPNSITKVRVYVWIEGQDIDNYDFAQLGQVISVNFGFTKERYTEDTMGGYDGPSTDITPTAGA